MKDNFSHSLKTIKELFTNSAEYEDFYVLYLNSDNIDKTIEDSLKKQNSLNLWKIIKKFRFDSLLENIITNYPKFLTYQTFFEKYSLLWDSKEKPNVKAVANWKKDDQQFKENSIKLVEFLKFSNIVKLGNSKIFLSNDALSQLSKKMKEVMSLSDAKNGKKLINFLAMIRIKRVNLLNVEYYKIQRNSDQNTKEVQRMEEKQGDIL